MELIVLVGKKTKQKRTVVNKLAAELLIFSKVVGIHKNGIVSPSNTALSAEVTEHC